MKQQTYEGRKWLIGTGYHETCIQSRSFQKRQNTVVSHDISDNSVVLFCYAYLDMLGSRAWLENFLEIDEDEGRSFQDVRFIEKSAGLWNTINHKPLPFMAGL